MAGKEPTIQSRVLYGIDAFLARDGVVFDSLMRRVGLEPPLDRLIQSDVAVPLQAVAQVFELAAVAAKRPCFGFEYAEVLEVGVFGSLGFMIAHAPTVREALENVAHYTSTVVRPMEIAFFVDGAGIGEIQWSYPAGLPGGFFQFAAFTTSAVIKRLQGAIGEPWTPLRIDVMHREPPCPAIYKRLYGERARFNQSRNIFSVDPTTLMKKSAIANARLYAAVRVAANAELSAIATVHDTVDAVRRAIQPRLSNRAPTLDEVAEAMGYKKSRNLQWKLEQEGTTFEKELSETRRLLAERLLVTTDLSMTQIAAAIGFSELSSFTRAAKLWFGVAPSEYRISARGRASGAAA
jgi:AraC-like DNA-binding protein